MFGHSVCPVGSAGLVPAAATTHQPKVLAAAAVVLGARTAGATTPSGRGQLGPLALLSSRLARRLTYAAKPQARLHPAPAHG